MVEETLCHIFAKLYPATLCKSELQRWFSVTTGAEVITSPGAAIILLVLLNQYSKKMYTPRNKTYTNTNRNIKYEKQYV